MSAKCAANDQASVLCHQSWCKLAKVMQVKERRREHVVRRVCKVSEVALVAVAVKGDRTTSGIVRRTGVQTQGRGN